MDSGSRDPVDAITSALTRLRGRRRPRPPWDPAERGAAPHHHGRGHGAPPWAGGAGGPGAGGRFGGIARLRLLDALAEASSSLTVSEVASAIGVDQPRASRLVQQAVDLGFAQREADPDDARRTRVALTDQGRATLRAFRGERRDAVGEALAGFTDAERSELARLLTKLADAWPA